MATVQNNGRLVNFIAGINGVNPGGQATVNMPVNLRMHRNIFQCACTNYTGGVGLATKHLTGAGNDAATTTLTVVNGVITAAAVVAGGAGYVTGDTITPIDATGTGAVLTVTAGAGAVTGLAVTNGGTASAVNPATMLTSVKQIVNGVVIRDITPAQIVSICQANNYFPRLGELPLLYTEPWLYELINSEATSWDLFGQSTFQLQFAISPTVTNPQLTGISEFDYSRNTRVVGKNQVLSLQPVAQHQFTFNVPAGRSTITTLPIQFPIRRLWMSGSTPSNVTQVEVYQDKNKILECTDAAIGLPSQIDELYNEYNFQLGQQNFLNQNYAGTGAVNKALQGSFNPVVYFDSAYISDPDGRFWKALKCQTELVVVVYSAIAQTITIVSETLPGAYKA